MYVHIHFNKFWSKKRQSTRNYIFINEKLYLVLSFGISEYYLTFKIIFSKKKTKCIYSNTSRKVPYIQREIGQSERLLVNLIITWFIRELLHTMELNTSYDLLFRFIVLRCTWESCVIHDESAVWAAYSSACVTSTRSHTWLSIAHRQQQHSFAMRNNIWLSIRLN